MKYEEREERSGMNKINKGEQKDDLNRNKVEMFKVIKEDGRRY
jgi:hypothetical protein